MTADRADTVQTPKSAQVDPVGCKSCQNAALSDSDGGCADGRTLGTLTSAAVSEDGATWAALAYLLCREKGQQVLMEGRAVQVDGQAAKVVDAPFLSRQFAPGAAPLVAAAAPKEPSPTDVRCAAAGLLCDLQSIC